jgi:uncharacterized protein (UPF0147 family)
MPKRLAFLCLAVAVLLLPCAAPALSAADEGTPAQKISLDLKDVPVEELLVKVSELVNIPYIIVGEIPADLRVTVKFVNAGSLWALEAVKAACEDVGLGVRAHQEVGILVRVPPSSSMPIPAAAPRGRDPRATAAPQRPRDPRRFSPLSGSLTDVQGSQLVDFEAEDLPLREAVAQLLRQLPEPLRPTIIVDEAVPREIRTTARVRKMSLAWVLDNLIAQSNLEVSVAPEEIGPDGQRAPLVIYLVPQPNLAVSGPGIAE